VRLSGLLVLLTSRERGSDEEEGVVQMSQGYSLDGYIEVPDRIVAFKEKYPDGSLQGEWELREIGGDTFVVYVARAYRTPDDERPAVGTAWEPYPGKTPYTKDSELMNAETSAWGRAIVALGFLAQGEKVASANEVRARQADESNGSGRVPPSDKQLDLIEKLLKKSGADASDVPNMVSYCGANLTGGRQGSASKLIDRLTQGEGAAETVLGLGQAAEDWARAEPQVPVDTTDMAPAAATTADEQIPF
jgi:hypothetical protein